MRLDSLLRDMDIEFFGTGKHGISPERAVELIGKDNVFFLDVRTNEELSLFRFPFAHHIPVNEIPDRLDEIPQDKVIIVFCTCAVRSAFIYVYLLEKGYNNVKMLFKSIEEFIGLLTPKPVYMRIKG